MSSSEEDLVRRHFGNDASAEKYYAAKKEIMDTIREARFFLHLNPASQSNKDEALADLELRADLEQFIKQDQLARLGWYLYTSGQLQVAGLPVEYDYTRTPAGDVFSERRKGYNFEVVEPSTMTFAGLYNPSPGRNERPYFPYGLSGLSDEEKEMVMTLNPSTTPSAEIVPMMERLGIAPSETARAAYFSEPMFIPDYARTNPKEFME